MSQTRSKIKGYVMGAFAFVACPCHLPITLPLLVVLTAGTAFSAWLSNNFLMIAAASTVIFVGALVLALKWTGRSIPFLASKRKAPAEVVLVTSRRCKDCNVAAQVWNELAASHKFRFEKVEIMSGEGRSLAARHNILATPTTLIDGKVAFRGIPKRHLAKAAVRRPSNWRSLEASG
ncbi:MAG: hypothetical protein BMS9Abin28_0708 [Anaerolineae bacterium]|nr:MAG: hypothetical protein BMS9Abin28_0708 [Anaerolineae bacterium]